MGHPSIKDILAALELSYLAKVLQGLRHFAVLSQHFRVVK